MEKTYSKFKESCGHEGEDWLFYVLEQGNEEFLAKLKSRIIEFEDLEGGDSYLKSYEGSVPEAHVDIVIFETRPLGGYMSLVNKCDRIIDPAILNDIKDEDEFMELYYKGSLIGR